MQICVMEKFNEMSFERHEYHSAKVMENQFSGFHSLFGPSTFNGTMLTLCFIAALQ